MNAGTEVYTLKEHTWKGTDYPLIPVSAVFTGSVSIFSDQEDVK
jgi:hypothetical protein